MEKSRLSWAILILGILIIAFAGFNFTGFAVYDSSSFTLTNTTKSEALVAINDSSLLVEKLRAENFSVSFFENMILDAYKTLEVADYAEILRDKFSTAQQKQLALSAVKLSDWKNTDYGAVVQITDNIKLRVQETYLISDRLLGQKMKIENAAKSGANISDAELKLNLAIFAFKNERYEEANNLIRESQNVLEIVIAENARQKSLKIASMNFFKRYWISLLIFAVVFVILFIIFYKKIKVFNLHRKIDRMHAEKQALHNLLIRAQKERYKENKISGLVYNVRFKNYQNRINQIDEEIPVLEARLKGKKIKKGHSH